MKILIVLLIVAVLGIAGYQYYQRTQHPTLAQRTGDAVDTTKEKAGELKETVVEQSKKVGETMDDARITTAIKGKYLLDKDLSTLAISVSCTNGHVSLKGTVASEEFGRRAVRLAQETSGVSGVSSQLVVKAN
ncbi:MAG: BON domain-containing protein [Pseudomonadota bacterium]